MEAQLAEWGVKFDPAATDEQLAALVQAGKPEAKTPEQIEAEKAAAEAAEAEATKEAKDDPLLKSIFKDMEPTIEAAPETNEEAKAKADEAKAKADAEAAAKAKEEADAKAKADAEAEAKAKKKKKAAPTEEEKFIDEPAKETAAPRQEPPKAEVSADEAKFVESLTEEQREELHEAEVAERLFPDRHKGRRKALLAYYKTIEDSTRKLLEEDPQRTLDESDEEFVKLTERKPGMSAAEYKRTLREIAAEDARKKVGQDIDPRLEEINLKTRRLEVAPMIEKVAEKTLPESIKSMFAADEKSELAQVFKVIDEKGPEEFAKEYPLEAAVAVAEVGAAKTVVREFLMLTKGAARFDEKNQAHNFIIGFIDNQGEQFAERGGDLRNKAGKQFLPRRKFSEMLRKEKDQASSFDPERWQTGKYWTFTDSDIVNMVATQAKQNIEHRVKWEIEQAEKRGFVRVKRNPVAEAPKAEKKTPQEIEAPKISQKASGGGAKTDETPTGVNVMSLFPNAPR